MNIWMTRELLKSSFNILNLRLISNLWIIPIRHRKVKLRNFKKDLLSSQKRFLVTYPKCFEEV